MKNRGILRVGTLVKTKNHGFLTVKRPGFLTAGGVMATLKKARTAATRSRSKLSRQAASTPPLAFARLAQVHRQAAGAIASRHARVCRASPARSPISSCTHQTRKTRYSPRAGPAGGIGLGRPARPSIVVVGARRRGWRRAGPHLHSPLTWCSIDPFPAPSPTFARPAARRPPAAVGGWRCFEGDHRRLYCC